MRWHCSRRRPCTTVSIPARRASATRSWSMSTPRCSRTPEQPGQSVLEDGARVPAGTSRRLACDASRVVMRHDPDGRIVEVGARTRTIPPAFRRALHHRDRGCRFPGCGSGSVRAITSATGRRAARRRCRTSRCCAGGTTGRSTRRVTQVERLPDGELQFRGRTDGSCPTCRLRRRCPLILWRVLRAQHEAAGLRLDARTACRAGWGSRWMWAGRSTSCIRWLWGATPVSRASTVEC